MELVLNFDSKALEKKLGTAIDSLPRKVSLELKKAARDIESRAKKDHRFTSRTGNLENSIKSDLLPDRKTAVVGLDKKFAPYGNFVHDGTKPHNIPKKPKPGKSRLRWVGSGGKFRFAKQVRHPGTKPDRFITKAADNLKNMIVRNFSNAIANSFRGK
jgi:HK97 gp10 family phage protein